MKSDEVARYLQDNPKFFENYADLLSQAFIPHPHGGRAISITERQVLTLRERTKQLETKLGELIHFGEENDAIGEKVHRLATALLAAPNLAATLRTIYDHLVEDFAIPHVAIRLWNARSDDGEEGPEFDPVSDTARGVAGGLTQPYCGSSKGFDVVQWFGDAAEHLRSLALLALRDGDQTLGLLVLASEEAERFYPEMGTVFLSRIGELASAALRRDLTLD
ncbi:MAG: DUF484 family protein [Rhodocyclaceae bacterium]